MQSTKLGSCYAVAAAAVLVGLAACAGESTSPGQFKSPTSARFALGDVSADATPVVGQIKVCKSAGSNVSGTFSVTRTPFNGNTGGTVLDPATVNPGECKVVAEDFSTNGTASDVVIDETSAGFQSATAVGTDGPVAGYTDATTALRVNAFHGFTVTYVNFVEPPSTGCTYTKGWYRNNGSNTIIALADGLTKSQQQQVFNATPGKPGLVTWTGGNNTLNLYQQLLAAINNLGGETGGPAGVDAAIAAAIAGTDVTTNGGGVQIGLVAGTDVSGLITTLSAFNEGSLTDWPHCAD